MTTRFASISMWIVLGMGCASEVTGAPSGEHGGGSPDPDYGTPAQIPAVNCDHPPSYEEVSAFNTCVMCHATSRSPSERTGAPLSVNFDTEAAAEANSMRAVSLVMGGLMPPTRAGIELSEEEKQELYDWAMCKM